MSPLLELRGVTKTYVSDEVETHALRGVDLSIAAGEYVVLTGPSGCGKSTLMSLIGLLDEPTSGELLVSGHSTATIDDRERARVRGVHFGFVFQSFHLIPQLSILDNVAAPYQYNSELTKTERARRAMQALSDVGMADMAERKPNKLSGGQQQRVAFARAIVRKPDLILADEPTGNLDSENSERIMQLLGEAHRNGTAICLVTHDPRYAAAGDRTIVMRDGRIIQENVHVKRS